LRNQLFSDEHVDPVGALVGQRGVRVAVVTSELGGEKIDVVEWSENAADFVKESLKPAQILSIELHENENRAVAQVADDQQSLAIGRGGQNVRLAAKLTGWNIDIVSAAGEEVAESNGESVAFSEEEGNPSDIAGVMPTESVELVDEVPQITELPAEEELTSLPASDETAADKEEDRDVASDE
jgi:N utilization substance protein A